MEEHIQGAESRVHMLRVDILINIQNTGKQCMKNPCKEIHTSGANMDIHTRKGLIELLAQNVI
jgi:hypothetical protein